MIVQMWSFFCVEPTKIVWFKIGGVAFHHNSVKGTQEKCMIPILGMYGIYVIIFFYRPYFNGDAFLDDYLIYIGQEHHNYKSILDACHENFYRKYANDCSSSSDKSWDVHVKYPLINIGLYNVLGIRFLVLSCPPPLNLIYEVISNLQCLL